MRLAEKEKKKPKQKGNEGMHHKDDAMTSIERATLTTSIEISGRFCVTVTGSDYWKRFNYKTRPPVRPSVTAVSIDSTLSDESFSDSIVIPLLFCVVQVCAVPQGIALSCHSSLSADWTLNITESCVFFFNRNKINYAQKILMLQNLWGDQEIVPVPLQVR